MSGVPSPSTNASASFTAVSATLDTFRASTNFRKSAPAEVTTNAAASLHVADAVGVFGAILVGALFGM